MMDNVFVHSQEVAIRSFPIINFRYGSIQNSKTSNQGCYKIEYTYLSSNGVVPY